MMINPVTKALNKAARHQYYGFLSEKQFSPKAPNASKGYKGPEWFGKPTDTSGQPAKPKPPLPTLPAKAAQRV